MVWPINDLCLACMACIFCFVVETTLPPYYINAGRTSIFRALPAIREEFVIFAREQRKVFISEVTKILIFC